VEISSWHKTGDDENSVGMLVQQRLATGNIDIAPKPEIITSLELRQIGFRRNSNAKFRIFDDDELDKRLAKWLRQRSTTKIARLAPKSSILPFPVAGRCRNRPRSVSALWSYSKIPDLPLELSSYLSYFRRYNYFRFSGHDAIFGCRSLSESLDDTLFGLAMVENPYLPLEFLRYLL